ncbi:flagellar export protein FliJ [Halothiobacillus sp. DCM-1]|uniref:flagellar export protein FliJ n=1 Tax=Halothiobacillus sp. DCM-1 TaxID=3112558 RepID=UPI00324476ED
MSQARIARIRQVEKITDQRATLGQEAVAACQRQLDEQRARLTQLTDYLAEYAAGIGFAPGGRSQVFALQNYRAFMEKIEQTIAHQQQVVSQLEGELVARQQEWREWRSQHRSVEKLRGRVEQHDQRDQERRAQQENDAHALAHYRNPLDSADSSH